MRGFFYKENSMEWLVAILLRVLVDEFQQLTLKVFKNLMLKKGIKIKAEKNLEHIEAGTQALSEGNLKGWLDELNNESN